MCESALTFDVVKAISRSMTSDSHIILRLRDEAAKKRAAALERAEKAQREADRFAIEVEAYDRAIKAMERAGIQEALKDVDCGLEIAPKTGASDKWVSIYRALHETADAPYTYDDLSSAVELAGHEASAGGQRTQMMNAVKAGWFNRVGHGKFEFTESGLALIGADRKENEPPEGGSEAEEGATSSDMQSEPSQGLPSAHSPDPAGQTRHWKMPGT